MAEKRVLEAGEYQGVDHLIKAPPAVEQGPSSTCLDYDSESADLELPTEDVFALAKDDPTSVSTAIDLAQLRKKHQEFLLLQASLGSEVVSEAGRAALVSVRERDAELAAKTVTTWDKSIKAFKALAGLDDGGSGGQQQGGLHLHQHLHSANNPFG